MKKDNEFKFLDFMDKHPIAFVVLGTWSTVLFALVSIAIGGGIIQLIGWAFK